MINTESPQLASHAPQPSTNFWRSAVPVATLIFLSPVLTELLAGIVTISRLWLLIPEMGVYGGAALLIREATRRLGRGWGTILLLGVAYAIAEECVILQTSLTPQFFPAGTQSFGWALGVQWSYFVAMLGYESVYAIVLPIALTEILFPARRNDPWLSQRGLAITAAIFTLASIGVWRLWSQVGVARYSAIVTIAPLNVILGAIAVVALAGATLALGNRRQATTAAPQTHRHTWWPWALGLIAFILGLFWWLLVIFAYLPKGTLPAGASPLIPIIFGVVWASIAFGVVRWLAAAANWQDRHTLALIFGATLSSMLAGTLVVLASGLADIVGKLVLDFLAIVLLSILAWCLRPRRTNAAPISVVTPVA